MSKTNYKFKYKSALIYFLNNRVKIKKYNKEYMSERFKYRKRFINRYKLLKGCESCGYDKNPVALQFDHKDRLVKSEKVSNMRCGSMIKLKNEIRKCRVLCANCHSIKTHKNKDYKRIN